jgi:hypothetical protein
MCTTKKTRRAASPFRIEEMRLEKLHAACREELIIINNNTQSSLYGICARGICQYG